MKVPLSWLKDYVDITLPVEELAERLTLAGLEVEHLDYVGVAPTRSAALHSTNGEPQHPGLVWDRDKIVIGQIVEVRPHPNADRLVLADVEYGAEKPHQVVTGAPNLFHLKGQGRLAHGPKVVFAKQGATLYDGHQPGQVLMTLKPAKLRGVPSDSMVCSEKELGLSDEHEGILLLDDDAPVGVPAGDYLGDVVLDIAILPNIARAMSIIGVAREVAALTGQRLRYPSSAVAQAGPPIKEQVEVEIRDSELNPRFTAMLITGVQIAPAPYWMQRRLRLVGMRPINNIVDVTNYVMLEVGEPSHAFDYDQLVKRAGGRTPKLITRLAQPGERLLTLDGVERALDPFNMLVTDTAGPLGLAGIMGGGETEVSDSTTSILLEAANWDFINVRRTMQSQRIASEAGTRFGRGVHPALALLGVRRGVELMRQLAGGAVAQGVIDVYPKPAPTIVIDLTTAEVERILGFSIPLDQIVHILESLEFKSAIRNPQSAIRVTVPDHRLDCDGPDDLIEEIARIYGYDRIPRSPMNDEMPPQRDNADLELEELVRDALVEAGLQEVVTYAMTTPAHEAAIFAPGTPPDDRPYVAIANPISAERTHMRHTLLAALLDTVAANVRHHAAVNLFEISKVYLASEDGPLPDEPRRLAIALTGQRAPEFWQGSDTGLLGFYDLKGVIETVVAALHIDSPRVRYEPSAHPTYHPGRAAKLILDDRHAGSFGELHPRVREAFDLPNQPVLAAELDFELLVNHARRLFRVRDVPRYPAVTEDLAVIVNNAAPAAVVRDAIIESGGELLRDVALFDVFRGEQIGSGKKSLAYRLTYQAEDRTLTDAEVAKVRAGIVRHLQEKFGATLRG
ncbi:MAG TPA: phenylalanine--tRNA ligase subunit beta [Anaerolineae bacterium]|nr:phenylalanine--tRNA ligase subunit beta [Anaerolineae bacterium]